MIQGLGFRVLGFSPTIPCLATTVLIYELRTITLPTVFWRLVSSPSQTSTEARGLCFPVAWTLRLPEASSGFRV